MDNIILEEIEKILKEELSVNNEIDNISEEIMLNIGNDYKIGNKQIIKDSIYLYSSSFTKTFLDKKIYINYKIYNFLNNEVFQMCKDDYGITDGSSACLEGGRFIMVSINGYCVSGTLNKALLLDTIRHEIEHIFQQIKSGKVIPQNNAYNTFAQPMYLYNEDNITKTIANLIYLSERFEIDAMVNGLYGELKEMGGKGISRYGLMKTYAYGKYKEYLRLYNDIISFDKQVVNNILKKGDINYMQFIKRIEWGKKYFINKIGKVFFKYKKDMLKENNWSFYSKNGKDLKIF